MSGQRGTEWPEPTTTPRSICSTYSRQTTRCNRRLIIILPGSRRRAAAHYQLQNASMQTYPYRAEILAASLAILFMSAIAPWNMVDPSVPSTHHSHPLTLLFQAQNLPFPQILPTVAFLLFFMTDLTDSPDCLPILLSISVFTFSAFDFLVVGSAR